MSYPIYAMSCFNGGWFLGQSGLVIGFVYVGFSRVGRFPRNDFTEYLIAILRMLCFCLQVEFQSALWVQPIVIDQIRKNRNYSHTYQPNIIGCLRVLYVIICIICTLPRCSCKISDRYTNQEKRIFRTCLVRISYDCLCICCWPVPVKIMTNFKWVGHMSLDVRNFFCSMAACYNVA